MTLTEHKKRMNTKQDSGFVFNECSPGDEIEFVSLEEGFLRFEKERRHVRHDDFSGLLCSSMLTDIPYENLD